MKNLILIVSLVFLTACGKDVGKNNPIDNPTDNPANWGDPTGEIWQNGDKNWVFAGSNVQRQVNCSSPQERSTPITVDFNGRIFIDYFILTNNNSIQYNFKLVNVSTGKECSFSKNGTLDGREVFSSKKDCYMNVLDGDTLEIQYIGSCNHLQAVGFFWED